MKRSYIKPYNNIVQKVAFFFKSLRLDKHGKSKGRKLAISIKDSVALFIFKQENAIETKKSIYDIFNLESVCSYKTLVVNMNRFASLALLILVSILKIARANQHLVKHTDSTDIPVCLNKNARSHKTMKGLANWGHSGKGLYCGLKLHITSDLERQILAVRFTSANVHDKEVFLKLNRNLTGIFVADAAYVSKKLSEEFHIEGERILFAKPRKNMGKIMTKFQEMLYGTRMMVEFNFRNLKMFFGLVTSLPRSVNGYLANYIHSLLAYLLA